MVSEVNWAAPDKRKCQAIELGDWLKLGTHTGSREL